MMKFSWLELSKALIVIAAWLLKTRAEKEAKAAGVFETLTKALQEANDAIDQAKAARDGVRADVRADPGKLRDPDEFTRD